jgi:hypothetical protein
VWQHEAYDRIVRNEVELKRFSRYILENPVRRWPGLDYYPHMGIDGDNAPTDPQEWQDLMVSLGITQR